MDVTPLNVGSFLVRCFGTQDVHSAELLLLKCTRSPSRSILSLKGCLKSCHRLPSSSLSLFAAMQRRRCAYMNSIKLDRIDAPHFKMFLPLASNFRLLAPFWSGADHRDFHHMASTNNYFASFRWWDRICRTDEKALNLLLASVDVVSSNAAQHARCYEPLTDVRASKWETGSPLKLFCCSGRTSAYSSSNRRQLWSMFRTRDLSMLLTAQLRVH